MLLEFTFDNFKCYRDETDLSMEAATLSEHNATLIDGPGSKKILPVAVVYGPNGGGKSSVLQAMGCMRDLVILPYMVLRQRDLGSARVRCRPYAFDAETRESPTSFRAVFAVGDYTYRYILAVRNGVVTEEYLHRRKAGRGSAATLFERVGSSVELGSWLSRKGANTSVDEMMPYLTFLAINYDYEPIDEPFAWFLNCQFMDYSKARFENVFFEPKNEESKSRLIDMLNNMGIDVSDIRYERDEDEESVDVYVKHAGGGNYELEISDESNGTKKLMGLLPMVLTALEVGALLISDELDAKLHPKLLRYLVRLFTDRRTNPNGAQLIFTSHDMSTLSSSVFRRDEIWFAARSPEESASLYSLADIANVDGSRIRPQNAYDRQYLEGRYGADPYLRSMLEWSESDE
ncbi:AAA family ATPase [Adlercreutzia caecimuris]|uniref:AAA family ATPase n=1 Tax=Adlercreutzia caecimuris TaxID=671266 RepID=UPI00272B19EE|nr:AAA family ATPase [Adlercreutzia caecimuris]